MTKALAGLTEDQLQYFVGAYYGWSGTGAESLVKIRVVKGEVWACSQKGQELDGDERHIYRLSLQKMEMIPPIKGRCSGREYGHINDRCYDSTMLSESCTIQRPEKSRECRDLLESVKLEKGLD